MYMIPATVMILFLMIMIETWNQSFYGLENSYMKIFTNRSVLNMWGYWVLLLIIFRDFENSFKNERFWTV